MRVVQWVCKHRVSTTTYHGEVIHLKGCSRRLHRGWHSSHPRKAHGRRRIGRRESRRRIVCIRRRWRRLGRCRLGWRLGHGSRRCWLLLTRKSRCRRRRRGHGSLHTGRRRLLWRLWRRLPLLHGLLQILENVGRVVALLQLVQLLLHTRSSLLQLRSLLPKVRVALRTHLRLQDDARVLLADKTRPVVARYHRRGSRHVGHPRVDRQGVAVSATVAVHSLPSLARSALNCGCPSQRARTVSHCSKEDASQEELCQQQQPESRAGVSAFAPRSLEGDLFVAGPSPSLYSKLYVQSLGPP